MHRAIIYEGDDVAGQPPIERQGPSGSWRIVAVAQTSDIVPTVRNLADLGAEVIELCGGVSPQVRGHAQAAVDGRAMVTSIAFGIESLAPAARYSAAFETGAPPPEAFIILWPNESAPERITRRTPSRRTIFAFVPDADSAVRAAQDLAAGGVGLVELYGGFDSLACGAIIEAVDGRAAVGIGGLCLADLTLARP